MPRRPKNIHRLWEDIVVDKPRVDGEQAHQKNYIATAKDNAKHLQSTTTNSQFLSHQQALLALSLYDGNIKVTKTTLNRI